MVARAELVGIEQQLMAQYPALADRHTAAARAGAERIRDLIERRDAVGDADAEAFAQHLGSIQRSAVAGYAASVRGIVQADDVARWISVRDALKLSAYDALLGEVDAPGAASLLDALEAVPEAGATVGELATLDQMLAAIDDKCTCGYARTGVLPKQTCYVCAEAITAAWMAEEDRILPRVPELHRELDELFDVLVDRLAQLELTRDGDTWALFEHERRKAQRQLARLNRSARKEIFDGMLTTWRELAAAASHDHRPIARSLAKGWKRSGLGTARLSTLTLQGNPEVKARMKKIAQQR
ncbi:MULTISPECIES: hypothetical protein [Microbacterium]|uniref:Uncharacterized protein n=1 Tax=Microbacterium oxydans TaxID=82380 RepID=A0A3S9WH13_9MICO|nr:MULTISPECIES: hypothetical protein [Microbacterium]AZS39340.1 hypothetical protein CVS54_00642 [Microbacterium oxydans]KKX99451.1 hypothetical protein AAY78_01855 [Microbacterium sp. Ag1]